MGWVGGRVGEYGGIWGEGVGVGAGEGERDPSCAQAIGEARLFSPLLTLATASVMRTSASSCRTVMGMTPCSSLLASSAARALVSVALEPCRNSTYAAWRVGGGGWWLRVCGVRELCLPRYVTVLLPHPHPPSAPHTPAAPLRRRASGAARTWRARRRCTASSSRCQCRPRQRRSRRRRRWRRRCARA